LHVIEATKERRRADDPLQIRKFRGVNRAIGLYLAEQDQRVAAVDQCVRVQTVSAAAECRVVNISVEPAERTGSPEVRSPGAIVGLIDDTVAACVSAVILSDGLTYCFAPQDKVGGADRIVRVKITGKRAGRSRRPEIPSPGIVISLIDDTVATCVSPIISSDGLPLCFAP
jgi:hypothetical protein